MGPFMGSTGTTAYEEKGVTYLAAINARWLPYLADEGVQYVHYFGIE